MCLPTASALPVLGNGDFGTSPLLGSSRTSYGLNRPLTYIVSGLDDTAEKKLPCKGRTLRGAAESAMSVAGTNRNWHSLQMNSACYQKVEIVEPLAKAGLVYVDKPEDAADA